MRTRHRVDTSTQFDPAAALPERRRIERADLEPVPATVTDTVEVGREPYIAGPRLAEAVNVAVALGRPLLLQGDPGAGKTRLAHAVAYALGLPLEEMYVKSTTRAQDLLYTYDAVRRLYDAQLPAGTAGDPGNVGDYVRLGPLGRAIARAEQGRRSVLLIDEIDKADIDFPNDLLRELDQLAFDVAEQPGRRHAVPEDRPDLRPIIFVTNNEEKVLPSAFLRRCVFHFVEFPRDVGLLDEILAAHEVPEAALREGAIDVLVRLRSLNLTKRPGLSELLDWVGYLRAVQTPVVELDLLPYIGALLKVRSDVALAETMPAPGAASPSGRAIGDRLPRGLPGGDGG
ncbi:MoxR-like ATPase [Parafrankia irregularis]|uniref:MoxR-like ATPase n=1 Tax=Parafrankia irregularis TaxID=795642 RepID=A0A0S4QQ12_9ACTN|nr:MULTISPECIES: MoxR family ATPase [Parafrankia]MBE3201655.1 MoxR family ATPase [Parafrankia sp. CH37]CUU57396.1 MoxR-like ATPase [Parafrankia irregularis]